MGETTRASSGIMAARKEYWWPPDQGVIKSNVDVAFDNVYPCRVLQVRWLPITLVYSVSQGHNGILVLLML